MLKSIFQTALALVFPRRMDFELAKFSLLANGDAAFNSFYDCISTVSRVANEFFLAPRS